MTLGWRSRGWMLGGFVALSAALVGWFALQEPVEELAARWPDAQRLDSLAVYVVPSAPTPPIDDYGVHLPALEPIRPNFGGTAVEAPPPDWRLSAILISGNRPVAIIDNQPVRPGEALEDGTTVVRIEPTQVIVRDVQGRQHTLRVANGD